MRPRAPGIITLETWGHFALKAMHKLNLKVGSLNLWTRMNGVQSVLRQRRRRMPGENLAHASGSDVSRRSSSFDIISKNGTMCILRN